MTPANAIARYHWKLGGGIAVPGCVVAAAALLLIAPSELCPTLLMVGYLAALFTPTATLSVPTGAERCLPATWTQLRRARAATHLGIAATALLPLGAYALRTGGAAPYGDARGWWWLVVLGALIPLWPLLCTVAAPLCWRIGGWRALPIAILAVGYVALQLWLVIASIDSPIPSVVAVAIGVASLAILPVACAIGAGSEHRPDHGASASSGTVLPAAPWLVRVWRMLAAPLTALPPALRALLLGVWLRPRFLWSSLVVPCGLGALCGFSPIVPILGMLLFGSCLQLGSIGIATVGGLLPRRTGLTALALPPLIALGLGFFAVALLPQPQIRSHWMLNTIEQADAASMRQRMTNEAGQLQLAYPGVEEVQLPDGSRLPIHDLVRRRAEAHAPVLSHAELAAWLARSLERDYHVRVDPSRLLVPNDGSGQRYVTSARVQVEMAAAARSRTMLFGLLLLAVVSALIACQVGAMAPRAPVIVARGTLIIMLMIGAAIALHYLDRYGSALPVVATDGSLTPMRILWWDRGLVIAVEHARPVAGALVAVCAALLACAWAGARWMPLVPERRTGLPG